MITQEEFFKKFKLDIKIDGIDVALWKDSHNHCWNVIKTNVPNLDELMKLTNRMAFTMENDMEFILTEIKDVNSQQSVEGIK